MNYLGFRWWRVFENGSKIRLRSLVQDFDWNLGGVTTAHFHDTGKPSTSHPAPYRDCMCGLYAWRDLPAFLEGDWGYGCVASYTQHGDSSGILVGGAVVTGGRVVLHVEEGMRVQQARPVAFGVVKRSEVHPLLRQAADAFGVPIFTFSDLQRYAHEFGDRQPHPVAG